MLAVNETACIYVSKRLCTFFLSVRGRKTATARGVQFGGVATQPITVALLYIIYILTGSKPATVAQRKSPSPQVLYR